MNERRLSREEISRFRRWVEAGTPRGEPATLPPREAPRAPVVATHRVRVPDYVPDPSWPDDYRCFVLDLELDRDLYLTAVRSGRTRPSWCITSSCTRSGRSSPRP